MVGHIIPSAVRDWFFMSFLRFCSGFFGEWIFLVVLYIKVVYTLYLPIQFPVEPPYSRFTKFYSVANYLPFTTIFSFRSISIRRNSTMSLHIYTEVSTSYKT